jgi:hypothetical protein
VRLYISEDALKKDIIQRKKDTHQERIQKMIVRRKKVDKYTDEEEKKYEDQMDRDLAF